MPERVGETVAAEREVARHEVVLARIAASRGKALYDVLAARIRISAVNAWNR